MLILALRRQQAQNGVVKTKIPPPFIGLLAAAAIWALNRAFPELTVEFPGQWALAMLIGAAGLALEGVAVAGFIRARTTINPLAPERASVLVTSGIYRLSRNPMYLGIAGLLSGFGLWLGNPLAALPIAGFVALINRWQIIPEEAALERIFGAEYVDYKNRVGRWL